MFKGVIVFSGVFVNKSPTYIIELSLWYFAISFAFSRLSALISVINTKGILIRSAYFTQAFKIGKVSFSPL